MGKKAAKKARKAEKRRRKIWRMVLEVHQNYYDQVINNPVKPKPIHPSSSGHSKQAQKIMQEAWEWAEEFNQREQKAAAKRLKKAKKRGKKV